MRKRGLIFFLIATSAWVYFFYDMDQARKSPEFLSVGYRISPQSQFVGRFAILFTLIGLLLFVLDFIRWTRRRSRDITS